MIKKDFKEEPKDWISLKQFSKDNFIEFYSEDETTVHYRCGFCKENLDQTILFTYSKYPLICPDEGCQALNILGIKA